MQIFVNPKYNFLRWRFHALALSTVFVLIGVGIFVKRGIPLGIDFAGGANIVLKFRDQVPMERLRTELSDASIQTFGKPEERTVLIRLPKQPREGDYAGQVVAKLYRDLNPEAASGKLDLNFHGRDRLTDLLVSVDPDNKGTRPDARAYYAKVAEDIINKRSELGLFTGMRQVTSAPGVTTGIARVLQERTFLGSFNVLSQETVGPQVGRELQKKAIWAIVLSVLAMGIYIAVRFDLKFGVAAVLCLVHDVLVTLAFLTLMPSAEFEILTVAALLMVVGYSINDKVVIYDRVRENLRKTSGRGDFETVLNESLNQSLSRTILTGGCVMLVLIALILLGGPVLNEFAWILLIGTIAGTYSTVTIAPAIVIAWNRRVSGKRPAPVAVRNGEPSREAASSPRKRKAG